LENALELTVGSNTSSTHTKGKRIRKRIPPPPSLIPLLITRKNRFKELNASQATENHNPSPQNTHD
jgi:hypothetical protein